MITKEKTFMQLQDDYNSDAERDVHDFNDDDAADDDDAAADDDDD